MKCHPGSSCAPAARQPRLMGSAACAPSPMSMVVGASSPLQPSNAPRARNCSTRRHPFPRAETNPPYRRPLARVCALAALAAALAPSPRGARALDNGMARAPPLGYNTWNDFRCDNITGACN